MSDSRILALCPYPSSDVLVNATDSDLAHELLLGNDEALAILVDRYQRLIYTIAFRIVHDKGEAEDLVQIVFLEIFRKVKLFDQSKGTFKVWLLRYAYTRSMNRRDQLEHRKFYSTVVLNEVGSLGTPNASLFDPSLNACEAARFIEQVLSTLNEKQRRAVDLIGLEGMTIDEAAGKMGCSLAATRNHYYRGMMHLRALVKNQNRPTDQCVQTLVGGNGRFEVGDLKPRTV
jgi:RNA polymerase sigma-70 factor (ECF subfamily)